MRYEVYTSREPSYQDALAQTIENVFDTPATILFFSSLPGFRYCTEQLHKQYPDTNVFGIATDIIFTADNIDNDLFVLCALDGDIECQGGILEEISRYPDKYADRITQCIDRLSDTRNTVCLEFTAAFYGCEELVLDTLHKKLASLHIPVAGGSTGIMGEASDNKVSYNGTVYTEAAIFMLLHNTHGKICLYRENIFLPTTNSFYATDVDVRNRIVYEFDDRPAADVLAETLGKSKEELQNLLSYHPLGRSNGDNIYITEGKEIYPDGSISFYASIYGNTKIVVLKPDDYRKVQQHTIQQIKTEIPNPQFAVLVNCFSRTKIFRQAGFLEEFIQNYADLFKNHFFCISGFGEQLQQTHFNQTLIAIVFE